MTDINVERTGENSKKITFDGTEVSLNRVDPYGYWYFSWVSNSPPGNLDQAFTSSQIAIEFLTNYLVTQKKPTRSAKVVAE